MHTELETTLLTETLRTEAMKANLEIQSHWNIGIVTVDEMSLLFESHAQLLHWEEILHQQGWRFDKEVTDVVTKTDGPHGLQFFVTFRFWYHENHRFRIECMVVGGPKSAGAVPLHDHALAISNGAPVIIHASFKCRDEKHYYEVLGKQEARPTAQYRNSYGLFSYYGWLPTYIKPRVNLRDS